MQAQKKPVISKVSNRSGVKKSVQIMGNETSTANATADQSVVDKKPGLVGVSTSSSVEADYVRSRIVQMEKRAKAAQPPPEVEPETESETEQSTESTDEVLSQENTETESTPEAKQRKLANLDIDELTDEDIRELAEKGKSGLLKRIAELTAKRKSAEEQLAAMKAEKQTQKEDPLKAKRDVPNPFADLATVEELQNKAQEIDAVIEEAEELLWNNEHMAADDVIATFEGKEFTKSQVRAILRQNQKARKDHLPSRLGQIQEDLQRKTLKEQYFTQAQVELEWLASAEDNDTRKQFEALRKSPVLEKAVKKVPELEPYLDYMIAHASNSLFNRKLIPIDAKPRPAARPNNPPSGGMARSEQPASRIAKSFKEAESRFKETGKADDFAKMRAAKFASRM
jgi:type I site-specific restriction endonuclease